MLTGIGLLPEMTTKPKHDARGEVLIALLKEKSDFAILQEQGWYRILISLFEETTPYVVDTGAAENLEF